MKVLNILFLSILLVFIPSSSWSMVTPHPLEQFDRGIQLVENYHGDEHSIAKAEEIFAQLITRFPDSPFGYVGMSRLGVIRAYLYADHYDMVVLKQEALPFAMKAIELAPALQTVHENYAIFEKIFANYNEQRKVLQQKLVKEPNSPQTYVDLAELLRDQQEYSKALEYYKIACGLDPNEMLKAKIFKQIAMIYLQGLNDPVSALEYFKKASVVCPQCSDLQEYLGRSYLELGKYNLAVEELTKVWKVLQAPMVEYYLMQAQGYLSQERGDLTKAISFFEKAVRISKRDLKLFFELGNLYYKQGKYEQAYNQFKEVIVLNPDDPGAYYLAGRSADNLGKTDVAVDLFRQYLQLQTDTPEAEWIRRNIPDLSHK